MIRRGLLTALLVSMGCATGLAQELSPRAFWPSPAGTGIVTMGYSYTTGDTLTDPSLPVTGVDSDLNTGFVSYLRSFDLAGRTSNFIVEVPYIWGHSEGELFNRQPARRNLDGLGDIALTMSVNLLGAPAMNREEFEIMRADPPPVLGVSLRLVTPTGDYDKDKFVNTGANRWAAKGEVGFIYPLRPKWLAEVEVGAWVFGDNDDFPTGKREQDPIYSLETHLIHRFRPGFWGSLDMNYYTGGRSRIDGEKLDDLQRTSKFGLSLVFPFSPGKAVKFSYSSGSASGQGNDFDSVLVSFNQRLP